MTGYEIEVELEAAIDRSEHHSYPARVTLDCSREQVLDAFRRVINGISSNKPDWDWCYEDDDEDISIAGWRKYTEYDNDFRVVVHFN